MHRVGARGWSELLAWEWTSLDSLVGRAIAIDAPNYLIRRLSIDRIRHQTGIPREHVPIVLGVILSALRHHIVPVFVFDGPPERLKRPSNSSLVGLASQTYRDFMRDREIADPEAGRLISTSKSFRWYFSVDHIREMCAAAGIPSMESPSDAEILASAMSRDGLVATVVSNDVDCLLFGTLHLIRALRLSHGLAECVRRDQLEASLGLDMSQLRDLAVLTGCDYSGRGVRGVGPRRGVLLLQRHGSLRRVALAIGFRSDEVEQLMEAREIFDTADNLPTHGIDVTLRAPVPSALRRVLDPFIGAVRTERAVERLTHAWKEFGCFQSTLA